MDTLKLNFIDYNSILVVNPSGKLRQLFVPFRVHVLHSTKLLKRGNWLVVEEVQEHKEHKLIYRIGKHWWQYDLFKLAATF